MAKPRTREDQKADGGRLPSKTLFKQFNPDGIYDLDEFRQTFLEVGDLYEYKAALKLVGSWKEWQRIKRDWPAFEEVYIAAWVEELELKQKSDAAMKIVTLSQDDSATGLSAAKWIAEGHHGKALKKQKVGRPKRKPSPAKEAGKTKAAQKETRQLIDRIEKHRLD